MFLNWRDVKKSTSRGISSTISTTIVKSPTLSSMLFTYTINLSINSFRFCYNIHDQIRQNDVVINLIGLILLFENTDVIKDDKDKILAQKYHALYNNLLRRYIESVHGNEAGSIIASIPRTLNDLNQVSTVAETIFAGRVKMDGTRRLPMEIFKTSTDEVLPSPPNQQPTTSA